MTSFVKVSKTFLGKVKEWCETYSNRYQIGRGKTIYVLYVRIYIYIYIWKFGIEKEKNHLSKNEFKIGLHLYLKLEA